MNKSNVKDGEYFGKNLFKNEGEDKESKYCSKCKRYRDSSYNFCPDDGKELKFKNFCDCGHSYPTEATYCPTCGNRILEKKKGGIR